MSDIVFEGSYLLYFCGYPQGGLRISRHFILLMGNNAGIQWAPDAVVRRRLCIIQDKPLALQNEKPPGRKGATQSELDELR